MDRRSAPRLRSLLMALLGACACATGRQLDDEVGTSRNGPDGGGGGTATAGGTAPVGPPGGPGGTSSTGGTPSSVGGSAGGSAGEPSAGGAPGAGGGGGAAADAGPPASACLAGEKRCGGLCVPPSPAIGCAPTGCTACPSSATHDAICVADTCSFACPPGEVATATGCTTPPDHCRNGLLDADESEIDCGGADCLTCEYRKRLTVSAAEVGSTLTDFPVLVSLTDADIAARSRVDGRDIVFRADAGELLDFEIERFAPGSDELVAWVRLPSVSATDDTIFYVHYGGGDSTDLSNRTGVWRAGYLGVYHMDYGGGAGTQQDSTSYGHHVAPPSGLGPTALPVGRIGAALTFDGGFERLELVAADGSGSALDVTTALSLSGWFYDTTGGVANVHPYYVVAKRGVDGTTDVHWALLLNKNFRALDYYMGEVPNPGAASVTGIDAAFFDLGRWVHFTVTVDQSGDLASWYTDGRLRATRSDTEGSVTWLTKVNDARLQIGGCPAATETSFQGHLDEIRVAGTLRSAEWVAAEHANQRSGSTFLGVGAEERP